MQAESASAWLASQNLLGRTPAQAAAVDADPCAHCNRANGIAMVVLPDDPLMRSQARGRIAIFLIDHHQTEANSCCLTPDQAKELVNHLGDAIRAAEALAPASADDSVRRLLEDR